MENAKIGPNSIIQTVEALKETYGLSEAQAVLQRGGLSDLIDQLPSEMIPERDFLHLVSVLLAEIGEDATAAILQQSGQRTAQYLLTHRIPGVFQRLVSLLPRTFGLKLFLWAISKNAWTFVGSGMFRFRVGTDTAIAIFNQPTAQHQVPPQVCSFYRGTFAHLFQTLIGPQLDVIPTTDTDLSDGQEHTSVRCAYRVQ